MGWLAILVSGLVVVGDEELKLRPQEPPIQEEPPRFRFDELPRDGARTGRSLDTLLDAPFSAGRASFFHATLEIPPMESARPLEAGNVYARIRTTHARSNHEEGRARSAFGENDLDGTYHEFASLILSAAPLPGLELTARAVFAGWDEHHDRFEVFNGDGVPVITHEGQKIYGLGATSRHVNLSVLGFGAKLRVADVETVGADLAVAASLKIPFGRDRDLTHAGTTDLALAALASLPAGPFTVHAQLGGTLPFGEQTLFVDEEDAEISPFVFAGLGVTWRAFESFSIGLQVEANTSAFRDVEFLDRGPASAVLGTRALWGPFVFEMGLGAGFDWSASYQWLGFASFGVVF